MNDKKDWLKEKDALEKIRHKYILIMLDSFECENEYYICLNYADGGTLWDYSKPHEFK